VTVAVIAALADISVPAARQALLAREKNGTATRVRAVGPAGHLSGCHSRNVGSCGTCSLLVFVI
jgi:hypothetical protein